MPLVFEHEQQALDAALANAAATERRGRIGVAAVQGVSGLLRGAVVAAAACAAAATAAHLLALENPALGWRFLAVCVGGCGAVGFVLEAWLHWRGDSDRGHLAQRLDNHNGTGGSIRAARELAVSACDAFSAVAVQDGLHAARKAQVAPALAARSGQRGWTVVALAALLSVSLFMPQRVITPAPIGRSDAVRDEPTAALRPAIVVAPQPPLQPDAPVTAPITGAGVGAARKPEAAAAGAEAPRAQRPSSGQPGSGRSAEVARASESNAAQGESIPGGAPPQESPEARRDPAKPRASAPPRPQKPKPGEEEKNGATAGQSGSGGGALSAVKSPWSQRDRGSADPLPENDTDERIEDDPDEEDARSGTQPTMKDRRGTTSKDLSISGPGAGGEGRGGPSLPKKSRGTGSLILGVPIPDFVRGLLNPGTTRITHERVQPSLLNAPYDAVVPTAARQRAAVPTPPAFVPQRLKQLLADYFAARTKGN